MEQAQWDKDRVAAEVKAVPREAVAAAAARADLLPVLAGHVYVRPAGSKYNTSGVYPAMGRNVRRVEP